MVRLIHIPANLHSILSPTTVVSICAYLNSRDVRALMCTEYIIHRILRTYTRIVLVRESGRVGIINVTRMITTWPDLNKIIDAHMQITCSDRSFNINYTVSLGYVGRIWFVSADRGIDMIVRRGFALSCDYYYRECLYCIRFIPQRPMDLASVLDIIVRMMQGYYVRWYDCLYRFIIFRSWNEWIKYDVK